MKKIIVAILGVMLCASNSFAVADATATGSLVIGGADDSNSNATNPITIGLSPKITARYISDGDTETTSQWFAIATVHPGGNVGYGTAQDVNNIYMMSFTTGDATTTVTENIPVTKTPTLTAAEIAADPNAKAATWVNNDWSLSAPIN